MPDLGLAGGEALFRALDAVVGRVADHVGQRIGKLLDDRLVDLGVLADGLEADLLAGLGGELADEARHAAEHRS